VVGIGRGIAEALAHAHARGVIHRDIKPENILVGPDGRVKVADFGTALLQGDANQTQTAEILGTPLYMAPEVARGGVANAQSDLFSLGAVLYELCAGKPPFAGGNPAAILHQVLSQDPPPLPAGTPPSIAALVRALLSKEPSRRPPNAAAVADRLTHATIGSTSMGIDTAVQQESPESDAGPPPRSIAILPFENLTGNAENDYLCTGIAEDLLTEVLKISDLKVASRTLVQGLKTTRTDPRHIGRDLGVGTVLEGGLRRSGERVRVTARLVRADNGFQLWADRYDRNLEDIFEVQEDIARQIAGSLRIAFEPAERDATLGRRTRSPKALDLDDVKQSIELFEEALREDPDYAVARADLAEACVQMICKGWDRDPVWLDRAEREANQALVAAPSLPEGYRALGHLWNHRRKLQRALRDFHRAVELDPRFAGALMQLGSTYRMLGDFSRAEVYLRRAIDLDPGDPRPQESLSTALLRQKRFAEGREFARGALSLPHAPHIDHWALGDILLSYAWERDLPHVAMTAEEFRRRSGETDSLPRAFLAFAAATLGDRREASRLLDDGQLDDCRRTEVFMVRARTHFALGDREAAMTSIERASALDIIDMSELETDPQLSTMRDDPRFKKVLASQE
jgi:serine/threonine-protein kinase